MDKLRIALVGTGNIAKQHVEAIISCNQELVGVCNQNIEKALSFMSSFASRPGVADAILHETVFEDLTLMLDTVKPDLLYVTTPHLTHVDIACLAVRRGIHCIIEKPLDISLAKSAYLLEEAQRTKALVSVISQSRFFRSTERIKNAIDDGRIVPAFGVVNVQAWRDEDYYRSNSWRGTWAHEGGGVLVNQSVHELDLLCYFLGKVESVYGIWRNINHPYIEVDDTAQAIVTFESGASATIIVSNSVNPAQSGYVHIVGTNGHTLGVQTHGGVEVNAGLTLNSFHTYNDVFSLENEETNLAFAKSDYANISDEEFSYHFFALQLKEMIHAIENQRDGMNIRLRNSIESAQGCMLIAQGIYLSQQLGRVVTRKEILDESMAQLVAPQTAQCKHESKASLDEIEDEPSA